MYNSIKIDFEFFFIKMQCHERSNYTVQERKNVTIVKWFLSEIDHSSCLAIFQLRFKHGVWHILLTRHFSFELDFWELKKSTAFHSTLFIDPYWMKQSVQAIVNIFGDIFVLIGRKKIYRNVILSIKRSYNKHGVQDIWFNVSLHSEKNSSTRITELVDNNHISNLTQPKPKPKR